MEKNKIDKEKYGKFIEGLEVKIICLNKSSAEINRDIFFTNSEPKEFNFTIKDDATYEKREEYIEVIHNYRLYCRRGKQKKSFLKIHCEFHLLLNSKEDFTDEFFKIYSRSSLILNTWPFFREFVNNATSRMNVPPLTLPFFKY